METIHPLLLLAERFPQLYLPVEEDIQDSILYQNIIKRGYPYTSSRLEFTLDENDFIQELSSPYGCVTILYLHDRVDFERFIRIMVYRCEPVEIPRSMGASMISGIIDWSKINKHKKEYEASGYLDWNTEFKRFTTNKENYQTILLVVGRGGYSALDYSETAYTLPEWEKISLDIRIYHEFTHFICRHRYGKSQDPIWDEIVADSIGLISAIGCYDVSLAKKFLGIQKDQYQEGRRLQNYIIADKNMDDIILQAKEDVELIAANINKRALDDLDLLEILDIIYHLRSL